MKSQELAEMKLKHPCNNSSSKYQFSFGKTARFINRSDLAKGILDKFYDLPSELSKHSNGFARSKRDLQKGYSKEGPSPCFYNPKLPQTAKDIMFKPGREVLTKLTRNAKMRHYSMIRLRNFQDLGSTSQKG
jgi:hypothetical protein